MSVVAPQAGVISLMHACPAAYGLAWRAPLALRPGLAGTRRAGLLTWGMVWSLDATPSGTLMGSVLFNIGEFDESTVAGWATGFRSILTGAVCGPGKGWRTLTSECGRTYRSVSATYTVGLIPMSQCTGFISKTDRIYLVLLRGALAHVTIRRGDVVFRWKIISGEEDRRCQCLQQCWKRPRNSP